MRCDIWDLLPNYMGVEKLCGQGRFVLELVVIVELGEGLMGAHWTMPQRFIFV